MKVAIVSTYDVEGGAARAAYRLHQALLASGVASRMFVQQRNSADPTVQGMAGNLPRVLGRLRWRLDQGPARLAGARKGEFSLNWLGGQLQDRLRAFGPDVVHLHWVNAAYVSIGEVVRLAVPLVWTAHDMWAFTGGCHYDAACGRYAAQSQQACQPCPMQTRLPMLPLARQRLGAKASASARAQVAFVAPSRWMGAVARNSVVGQGRVVRVIPNAIDLTRFKPVDKRASRDLFGLPPDRTVLLFGGVLSNTDPRKGFNLLDAALQQLASSEWASRVSLCVFGSATRGDAAIHGIPVRYVGHLHDEESLIALYSAADVFMAPSLQDNLPNTVMEAAACGLPTVAFAIGGMSDLIDHGVSGWLAAAGDVAALADAIVQAVRDDAWRAAAGLAARKHAQTCFSYPTVAAAHTALYAETLAAHRPAR